MRLGFLLTPALFVAAYWGIARLRGGAAAGSRPGAPAEGAVTPRQRSDRRVLQALAVAGAIQLLLMLFRHSTWTIDGDELLFAAGAVGAVFVTLLLAVARLGVGRRALVRWGALGLFGAVTCSAALLRDINQEFDSALPVARSVRIVGMQTATTLRGGTSYYLRLEDWTAEGQAREIDLSHNQYRGFVVGRAAVFEEHRGLLGMRWIGELRLAAANGPGTAKGRFPGLGKRPGVGAARRA